jgi:hypothetical protein
MWPLRAFLAEDRIGRDAFINLFERIKDEDTVDVSMKSTVGSRGVCRSFYNCVL